MKRLFIIGGTIGAGIVLTAAVIGFSVYWYYDHPRPARDWPDVEISQLGVKASLRTEWRDDKLSYQFRISPLRPDGLDNFSRAIESVHQPYSFALELSNPSGFTLCEIAVPDYQIKRDLDDMGRSASLIANTSATYECPLGRYLEVSGWNFRWNYSPTISSSPSGVVVVPSNKWRTLRRGMSKDAVRNLLGEPIKVNSGGVLEFWYYDSGGDVTFDEHGKIYGWKEP